MQNENLNKEQPAPVVEKVTKKVLKKEKNNLPSLPEMSMKRTNIVQNSILLVSLEKATVWKI